MPTPLIIHGDCRTEMRRLVAEGVQLDSFVGDPPYHLESIVRRFGSANAAPAQVGATGAFARASAGFHGQQWDGADAEGVRIAFEVEVWRLVYELLKPGAWVFAFGHERTYHRLACAIEDAGFDVRGMGIWAYATGFPKSRDVSADIDKLLGHERPVVGKKRSGPALRMAGENDREWHERQAAAGGKFNRTAPVSDEAKLYEDFRTTLKPSLEPICMARKPLSESSVARNVLKWGTGALNIRECRVPFASEADRAAVEATYLSTTGAQPRANQTCYKQASERGLEYDERGRWPGNIFHDGSPEVLAHFPTTAPARAGKPRQGQQLGEWKMTHTGSEYDDGGGSAARFFFQAKADDTDRVHRCKICGTRTMGSDPTCHLDDKGKPQVIRHPTVKPLDLMQQLVRLATPPGGTVLDCFAGTGSTGIAAEREGFGSVLIEQSATFVGDIEYRLAVAGGGDTPLFGGNAG